MKKHLIKYLKLIDKIFVSLLEDLSHLRFWLIVFGYVFNFLILGMVYVGKADYKLASVGIGLLTAIYLFYFASKDKQARNEHEIRLKAVGNDSGSDSDGNSEGE